MNTFKRITIVLLLICMISSVTVNAGRIGVDPSYIKWYIDSSEIGKEIQYSNNITFSFSNSTSPDDISVYIEGVDSELFRIETSESTSNYTKTVIVTLFANIPNDIFHRGESWDFEIIGKAMYGEYQQAVVTKITVYTQEQSNMPYIIAGVCIILVIAGLGWVISRKKEEYEKS